MRNRAIALMFAALLSLGLVACEGGTATDDGTVDPATEPGGMDDGLGGGEPMDDGLGGDPMMDDGLDDGTDVEG